MPLRLRVSPALALAGGLSLAACDATIGDGGERDVDVLAAPPTVRHAFAPDDDAPRTNPERGGTRPIDLGDLDEAAALRADGLALGVALVRLDAYRYAPLDDALLDDLDAGLDAVRAAGLKVILRFAYNHARAPDAPRDRILEHIGQLAPHLEAHADVIAVVQAGFIGAWGEWHGSTHGLDNDADRAAVLDALLAALPTSRSVQVRTPMYKEGSLPGGPLDAADAWTITPRARVGHHNDCFLASDSDQGTFDDPVEDWRAYVATDGRYAPIGGETCKVNAPRTDCDEATAALAEQHFSYLNLAYRAEVLDGWGAQGCRAEIERRLGYRIALTGAEVSRAIAPGGLLDVRLELDNRGFAAPFNPRGVHLVLRQGARRWSVRLADADARRLAPGASTIAARLRLPADLVPGAARLALWLPDDAPALRGDPRYAIALANPGAWDPATGENVVVAALPVDPAAGGSIDDRATDLTEL